MLDKPLQCYGCPLSLKTEGFVPFEDVGSKYLLVGEAPGQDEAHFGRPFVGGAGAWLNNMLRIAKHPRGEWCALNTILCRPPQNVYPTDPNCQWCSRTEGERGVRECWERHVRPIVMGRQWRKILALGGRALTALTGRVGIELWRGSPLPLLGREESIVMPTLHPAFLMRQASLTSVVVKDIKKHPSPPPEMYNLWPTLQELSTYRPRTFAFDFEWDWSNNVTLCGLSSRPFEAMVMPFTSGYVEQLKEIFEQAETIIGHNIINADLKFIEKWGWDISKATLLDTLLMQHLVQPDMRHGLAFVASVFTNKVFWKGKESDEESEGEGVVGAQWKTFCSPLALPRHLGGYGGCESAEEAYRLYNARDTDASFQIADPLLTTLERYGMMRTYQNVSLPIGFICRELGEKGLKLNRERLINLRGELLEEIKELDKTLPEGLRSYERKVMKNEKAPPGTYMPKTKTCKGSKKTPHPPVEMEWTTPSVEGRLCSECGKRLTPPKLKEIKVLKVEASEVVTPWNSTPQVLAYAERVGLKQYINPKTGNVSADKASRRRWQKEFGEFAIVDRLKQHSTLANSFAKPGLLNTSRMYFNLLVHGTAEGRLSSTGRRPNIDLNIQNIPEKVKVIFEPDHPEWGFLDADIGQGENKLTAWFAQDTDRLTRLSDPSYDEHSENASAYFGVEVTKTNINSYLRKPGKVIGHMLNYGASWKKLQEVLAGQGYTYSASECKEFVHAWQVKNAATYEWQRRTISLAQRQGFLQNPFGRRRWFQTRDLGPKSLAYLPASTLADCVLRMMIAFYPERFVKEIRELALERVASLPTDWRLSAPGTRRARRPACRSGTAPASGRPTAARAAGAPR
jgi:uracil-DNA glycosylase family 4